MGSSFLNEETNVRDLLWNLRFFRAKRHLPSSQARNVFLVRHLCSVLEVYFHLLKRIAPSVIYQGRFILGIVNFHVLRLAGDFTL